MATRIRLLLFLARLPVPRCLSGHSERGADLGPRNATFAQLPHREPYEIVHLIASLSHAHHAGRQFLCWHLSPVGDRSWEGPPGDPCVAHANTFIADVDARPDDQPVDLAAALRTERADL